MGNNMLESNPSEGKTILGLNVELIWGLVGVLLFIVGDGLEQAWISPFLIEKGMVIEETATLISIYGIAVAIGAWFSGVLAEAWGPRKTMLAGAILWIIGHLLFLLVALPQMSFAIMLPTYCIRGFGYPLFCYSYLVWITYKNSPKTLATAVGWFFVAFTGGLYVVSNLFASYMMPIIGSVGLLWSALVWVLAGVLIICFAVKGSIHGNIGAKEQFKILLSGITIIKKNPRVGVGGLVRLINGTSQFAMPVFYPLFLAQYGISTEEWLQIWALVFFVNIFFNIIWGVVGDKIGWGNAVQIFGGLGCGSILLLMAFAPPFFEGNFVAMLVVGALYGALIAGFAPLTALVPSLEPTYKGATITMINLGAGLASFVGPLIVAVGIAKLKAQGILICLAVMYYFSILLMNYVKKPETERRKAMKEAALRGEAQPEAAE
ncbi:MFS transporter [Dysgonomonas macrotermitis]|uniref:Polyol permease family n=1 Tax=Dysgonomonas macrotermitis TaxID=1346286 RepID=A0A1M5F9D8_9BACT|nr:MFS transporter [Dysgonomonas macrotermitis]SHF87702.1 polyol permease family [Dysgonomonas macrotermitis]